MFNIRTRAKLTLWWRNAHNIVQWSHNDAIGPGTSVRVCCIERVSDWAISTTWICARGEVLRPSAPVTVTSQTDSQTAWTIVQFLELNIIIRRQLIISKYDRSLLHKNGSFTLNMSVSVLIISRTFSVLATGPSANRGEETEEVL